MVMSDQELYDELWKTNGSEYQMTVAIEELAELQKEITKTMRGQGNKSHMKEEIADVLIVVEQLIREVLDQDFDSIDEIIRYKMNRTLGRLMEKQSAS